MSFLYRASRAVSRSAFRPPTSSLRHSIQSSRSGFLQSSFKAISRPTYSAFSTSCRWREAAGDSDQELSAKFAREKELEQESRDSYTLPAHLQDFVTNSSFKIKDIPGTENVILSREYNTETIKIEFSIDSINNHLDETQMEEDEAFEDEVDIAPKGKRTINQSGREADMMAEDSIAPTDRDEAAAGEEPASPAYPVQLEITITKPSTGAVQIVALADEGMIRIEQVNYFPEAELADPLTHEDSRKQNTIYAGPPFENLDPELQGFLERYLEERGIDSSLALFVPDYVDFKEQREYVQWLENMKKFIDA